MDILFPSQLLGWAGLGWAHSGEGGGRKITSVWPKKEIKII